MDHTIRIITRGFYDQQKLRIETGNRLCAQLRANLGQSPGETEEDDMADDAKAFLADLKADYKRITDGAKRFPSAKTFKGTDLISSYSVLVMCEQYFNLLDCETKHLAHLKPLVESHPLWERFLEPIRGCGILMAAVLLAEIDIHKAKHVGSLYRYSGYDVVESWKRISQTMAPGDDTPFPETDPMHFGKRVDGKEFIMSPAGLIWRRPNGSEATYVREGLGGRSKRAEHLVMRDYTNAKGEVSQRKSITFSPWLKTKLYVLATCLIKSGGTYKDHYASYKARIETIPHWAASTKAHRHNAAMRYMIKRFLADLYVAWRTIEGLPVHPHYVEKLAGHSLPMKHQEA